MAIIKCPECGGDISSQTKDCVHCGCKIKICPECGKALFERAESCDGCGYLFANASTEIISETITKDEKANKLERRIVQSAKIDKGMSVAKRVIDVLATLFFFACVLTPVIFKSIPISIQKIIMFVGFFATLGIYFPFAVADVVFELYATVGLKNWMIREGLDPKAYMKKYGYEAFDRNADIEMQHTDRMENLRFAAFITDNPREVVWTVFMHVIKIWRAALVFPLVWWIVGFVNKLTAGTEIAVSLFFTPVTITVIVLFVVFSIVRFVIMCLQEKHVAEYMEKLKIIDDVK